MRAAENVSGADVSKSGNYFKFLADIEKVYNTLWANVLSGES